MPTNLLNANCKKLLGPTARGQLRLGLSESITAGPAKCYS